MHAGVRRPTPMQDLWMPVVLAVVVGGGAVPAAATADCSARSGAATGALIELYTSEGCSSCPPADARLRALREAVGPNADVVPIALHVDYWDSIGWKDPFAQPAFAERQRWLVGRHGNSTVYTPHYFVNGGELFEWRTGLRDEVARINAKPARADLAVKGSLAAGGDRLDVVVDAASRAPGDRASLYVAVAESGLVSKVTRGENSGATLTHDHVVRTWIGPIPLDAGNAHLQRAVDVPPAWKRDRLELVAFVEDERSGDVLQAIRAPLCARPPG